MQPAVVNDDPPSLLRTQILGHLAAACRLALMDAEHADSVHFTVDASPHGIAVDCMVLSGGVPLTGWGQ